MARIRTIKPEFFTSEDIVSLTPLTRLLYIALWCEADREGRFEWKPKTFKMRYLPGDTCDAETIGQELIDAGLIHLYEESGKQFAVIPTFNKHQVINNRESESELPKPPIDVAAKRVGSIPPVVKEAVMARDGYRCVRCSADEDLTLDHILPQSLGGSHEASNLRCMCRKCNSARPVNGKALSDDLAADGFDLKTLLSRVTTRQPRVKAEGKEGRKGKEGYSGTPQCDEPQDDETPSAVVALPLIDKTEFDVTAVMACDWQNAYPAIDVAQQLKSMRAWLLANPENRKTRNGIERFIVRWLAKAQNTAPRGAVVRNANDDEYAGAI